MACQLLVQYTCSCHEGRDAWVMATLAPHCLQFTGHDALPCRYATYSNGYSESSHTVKLFWRVVRDMTPEQRCSLLRFITSTSRAPLGGFK